MGEQMKSSIFPTFLYQYGSENWAEQREKIKQWVDNAEYKKDDQQWFSSDREDKNQNYLKEFEQMYGSELNKFANELGRTFTITDIWLVKYSKGDWHPPHTHGSKGFSGILFVDYDEQEHTAPVFIDPINDQFTDRTNYIIPNVFEGDIVISRSNIMHFTYPNQSEKERVILGFDMNII
jgi:hypothetical protein